MLEIQRKHEEGRELLPSLGDEKVNSVTLLKGSTKNNFESNSKKILLSCPQWFPKIFAPSSSDITPFLLVLEFFVSIPLLLSTYKAKWVSLNGIQEIKIRFVYLPSSLVTRVCTCAKVKLS